MDSARIVCVLLVAVVPMAVALRCFQCGEYTDGVGSITPCINYTAQQHLKECPAGAQHCVKYVSEAITVRECAVECTEKAEPFGTKVFCCSEDSCNSAESYWAPAWSSAVVTILLIISYFQHLF